MTTGNEHYSSCGRYATIQSCIAYQNGGTISCCDRRYAYVDVVRRLHRRTDDGHGTGISLGLRIRWCAEYDERQDMAKDIASTSLLDKVHYRGITIVDFLAELEKARKLPTGRLWGGGLPGDSNSNNTQVHSHRDGI